MSLEIDMAGQNFREMVCLIWLGLGTHDPVDL